MVEIEGENAERDCGRASLLLSSDVGVTVCSPRSFFVVVVEEIPAYLSRSPMRTG